MRIVLSQVNGQPNTKTGMKPKLTTRSKANPINKDKANPTGKDKPLRSIAQYSTNLNTRKKWKNPKNLLEEGETSPTITMMEKKK